MGNAKLILTRSVTRSECPWLDADYPAGTMVYAFPGVTYGCISPAGRAVTMMDGDTPFMEFPRDALGDHHASLQASNVLPDGKRAGSEGKSISSSAEAENLADLLACTNKVIEALEIMVAALRRVDGTHEQDRETMTGRAEAIDAGEEMLARLFQTPSTSEPENSNHV